MTNEVDRDDASRVVPATGVILASVAATGAALGLSFYVAETWINDDLAALAIPLGVAIVAVIASLAALGSRGDRWTPLRMLGAWALLVPPVDGLVTAALLFVVSERSDYIAHAVVQSMVRAELAVVAAALVLARAWLRRRARFAQTR